MGTEQALGINLMQIGSAASSVLDEETRKFLVAVQPEEWYPAERLKSIIDQAVQAGKGRLTGRANVYAIREKILEAGVYTPEEALAMLNQNYQLFNRGDEIGQWKAVDVTDGHAELLDTTLYDCSFNEGIIEGFVTTLGGRLKALEHVACRKHGAPACRYVVEWEMKVTKL